MVRKFFYDTGEQQVGPVSANRLVQLRAMGEIDDRTWVRRADSSTWRPLYSVDLRKEEEEEANPSLWQLLTRSWSWQSLLLLLAVGVTFIAVAVGLVVFVWPILWVTWPILLVLFLLWGLSRLGKP